MLFVRDSVLFAREESVPCTALVETAVASVLRKFCRDGAKTLLTNLYPCATIGSGHPSQYHSKKGDGRRV